MLMTEADQILDDLLARFHAWAQSHRPGTRTACPMFRNAKSGRGWDFSEDIIEDELMGATMRAIDFQVSEMADPYRTAIHFLARNLSTGRNVWLSPRLPADPLERGVIVREARTMLTRRLIAAGVM